MNPNTTTVAAATASGTVSLALIVVLQWALSLAKISLPADVATALATVLAAGVHWFVARQTPPKPGDTAPAQPPIPVTLTTESKIP
ncbi:MAG: hypothetical protein PHU06_06205 [Gallionella sp.]|nr:hypothetical protein [Gallionella sp.]MDD4958442.1 hypothetical protein [Gallionella sp.]